MASLFLSEFAFLVATMALLASAWKISGKDTDSLALLKVGAGLVGVLFFAASWFWLFQYDFHFSLDGSDVHFLIYYLAAVIGVGCSSVVLVMSPD